MIWDPVWEAALLTETETNSWRNLDSVTGEQTGNAKRNKVPSASSSLCVCVCEDCITVCLRLQVDSLAVMCSLPRPARIVCQVRAIQLGTKDGERRKGWRRISSGHPAPPPSISPHFYLHLFIFLIPLCDSSSQTAFIFQQKTTL